MRFPIPVPGVSSTSLRAFGLPLLAIFLLCVPGPAGAETAATRAELEQVAAKHYDAELRARAERYHRPRYVLFFVQLVCVLGAASLLAWMNPAPVRALALRMSGEHVWLARALLLAGVFLTLWLVRLPFVFYRFSHAREFGLRHDSWLAFAGDLAKGVGIQGLLVVVVGTLLLTLFAAAPRWWWVASAGVLAVVGLAYAALMPIVIDPLFNRFEKLEDPVLAERVLELAERGGVPAKEVWIADASRRSRAANAYFTGFGHTRRIVLYDTLVDKFTADETALVVAHEVGHWKHRHIQVGMGLGFVAAVLGLLLGQVVMGRWIDSPLSGLTGRGDPAVVFSAYALYLFLSVAALVPSNWISRLMETQADRAALELTGDPQTFIATEVRLGTQNLSDVLPPSWIEKTLFTHPANARRILMAERYR